MHRRLALGFVALFLISAAPSAALARTSHDQGSSSRYEQPLWFKWNKAQLDVIIVPPAHGQIYNDNGLFGGAGAGELTPFNSYLAAIEKSVAAWDSAIAQFGAPWLQAGVVTNVYVAGRDPIPQEALREPEILITTDENKGFILGVAISTRPCIVDSSKFFVTSFTYADMFNINGHEYGHCLGLDHSFGSPEDDGVIAHDLMNGTYADTPGARGTHLHCPSNLNVRGLELVFGDALRQPVSGASVAISPAEYALSGC